MKNLNNVFKYGIELDKIKTNMDILKHVLENRNIIGIPDYRVIELENEYKELADSGTRISMKLHMTNSYELVDNNEAV